MSDLEPVAAQVRRVRAGDKDAFEPLVRRFRRSVQALALARLNDAEAAADVCQEAFVTAFQRIGELREPESFGPWLCRIAVNLANAERRRRRREAIALEQWPPEPSAEAPMGAKLASQHAAAAALQDLTEAEREVVCLRFGAGLTHRRIGSLLGISETASRSRLRRALQVARAGLADRLETATAAGGAETLERVMQEVYRIRTSEQVEAVLSGRLHPELLGFLTEGPKSAPEVAAELSLGEKTARWQLRELVRVGLAEECASPRGRRGARYRAVARKFVVERNLDDLEHVPATVLGALRRVLDGAEEVWATGELRLGTVLVRDVRCRLEDRDWVAARLNDCLEEIRERCDGEEGDTAVVLCCLVPQPPGSEPRYTSLTQE